MKATPQTAVTNGRVKYSGENITLENKILWNNIWQKIDDTWDQKWESEIRRQQDSRTKIFITEDAVCWYP